MSLYERLQNSANEKAAAEFQKGMDFLIENKKRPGVIETNSGLQYEVLVEGTGPKPQERHSVTTHYHGTNLSGKVFDSSVQRGKPISFPLSAVIKGWTEGLQLMPVGSKYKFFIPPHLAYGERGAGPDIPPNATLIFEVELIAFK